MVLQQHVEEDTIFFTEGDQTILWMKENLKDDTVEISIGGALRSEATHAFSDELLALVSVGLNLVLDFAEVTYISVAYMKALLKIELAIEKKGQVMRLIHLSETVKKVFEETGAWDLLLIE
jgi:anti-anti-sigma factor